MSRILEIAVISIVFQTLPKLENVWYFANEAQENPTMLQQAPHNTVVRRIDAVKVAREPMIVCTSCCT